ncbi:hypothetical protein CPter91_4692 [Collimonas pratensis]|uniref:Uncharacterized protein n=1 Tax=Collimonas pratensis TaxID=279113 RepID=A0A127QAG8_9BURK|nr:hypothetical protein CPter91_4692 [Collimonas pratensis]
MIRLTVSNLFSKQYLSMTDTNGSSFASNVNPVIVASAQ